MTSRGAIIATGSYLPERVLASDALERDLALEAGWIVRRTGVARRHIAAPHEAVSDLAVAAAADAMSRVDRGALRITMVILATSTPDFPLPATAPMVATRLGIAAPAFDLTAACSGFLYGLVVADKWLADGRAGDTVLVIGANLLSRRVNWRDPRTAPLFGDGAGAVLYSRSDHGLALLGSDLHSDGRFWEDIHIPAGGSRRPVDAAALANHETTMVMPNGGALFRRAVEAMVASGRRALTAAHLAPSDAAWFVPHQASARIIAHASTELGFRPDQVVNTIADHGNTSAASIPLALHAAWSGGWSGGRIAVGDRVLLAAAGSGLTAGAAVLEQR